MPLACAFRPCTLRAMPNLRLEKSSLTRATKRVAHAVAIAAALHTVALGAPGAAFAQAKGGVGALVARGTDLFEDQQYEESIQTLSAALLRPGTPKEQKVEIYRLLAYNYITLDRTEEADAAVRGLLVLDESFTLKKSESPRFRDFFTQTRAKWEDEGKPGTAEEGDGPAPLPPIDIKHVSPAQVEPGTTVKLTGTVTDPGQRVGGVQLNYRQGSKGKFITLKATFTMDRYSTQIPGSAVKPPLVEYYLEALDESGLPVATRGDATAPLRVVVPEPGGVLTSPWFWVPVGVVVAGGVILTAILASGGGESGQAGTSKVLVNVSE